MSPEVYLSIVLAFVLHGVVSFLCIKDLFTISRRSRKKLWLGLILLLPVVSAVLYRASMKRKKILFWNQRC